MPTIAAPPPIPGALIDPPPKETPEAIRKLEEKEGAAGAVAGVGYRAFQRYVYAKVGLLAAGTTYYLFLALFSIVAFAYGVTALIGGERLAEYLTDALDEAFPGLIGEAGIDPDTLVSVGRATSVVGLLVLLWAGSAAMVAASGSLHQIYGAAPDPRNYVVARVRLLGWLLLLGPLVMVSFVAATVVTGFADRILDAIGLDSTAGRVAVVVLTVLLTLAVDFLVLYLLLGNLGGIRPATQARRTGAAIGTVLIEILKYFMAAIIGFSVSKPQYGALAVPIGILLVLYLQCMATYGAACVTAGLAEKAGKDLPFGDADAAP